MKNFFTILAFASILAFSMSGCTEEEVKPSNEVSKSQGSASDKGF